MFPDSDSQDFAAAYITCALRSSTDDAGIPLDSGAHTLADSAREAMTRDAADFWGRIRAFEFPDGYTAEQAGHDYWLTRNEHGAGFWDRGLGELGERLSTLARAAGSVDLYVGDDGLIYQS